MSPYVPLLMVVGGGTILLSMIPSSTKSTDKNVEWLARIILTEAHPANILGNEAIGIAWVAINRSIRSRRSIKSIVSGNNGRTWFGGYRTPGWQYMMGIGTRGGMIITDHPRFDDVKNLARQILDGDIDNPIGLRRHFVHPGGMPSCESENEETTSRICQDTHAGLRWMPRWIISPDQGSAELTPRRVGNAVFAGPEVEL